MIRDDLTNKLQSAVDELISSGRLPSGVPRIELSEPRSREHGDFATNFAMVATKPAGMPPQAIAGLLCSALADNEAIAEATSAGPGFVNLKLSDAYLTAWAKRAYTHARLSQLENDAPQKILVEFVSVNPNGPIHLGHGRGAAYGDTLARVLKAAGHSVDREYYVNDGVNSTQMQLFALSVKAYYRELLGHGLDFPEGGYQGEHVQAIAEHIRSKYGDGHAEDDADFFQPLSQALMLEQQRIDLDRFGVKFDSWFSEQSLHDSGKVESALEALREKGNVYEQDGALFLRSTAFGDDKDRAVVRSSGEPTYIASDIAYHKDKFDRGYDHLINVWGPDHHGYVARTLAAMEAMGYDRSRVELLITQIVRFVENGESKPMRKRNGDFYRLSDLIDEIGADVCRFFYLMRSIDTHMDFDLGLAKEHSDKNPVYYAQYAHARICSLLTKAKEQGLEPAVDSPAMFSHPAERELIRKIWDLPFEVRRASEDRSVHRLTTYVVELARDYHNFYDKCPVIKADSKEMAGARLLLCDATRKALREGFELLGITAPESM